LLSLISIAIMRDACAIVAPITADSPMPPKTEDGDRGAGFYFRRVHYRTHAGSHAAAEQAHLV